MQSNQPNARFLNLTSGHKSLFNTGLLSFFID